jgi:hypothetical protein
MTRRRINLATVNPQGRFDVFLYRMAECGLMQFEQQNNLAGLCERVMPSIEQVIRQYVPARNVLPQEIIELWEFVQANRRKIPERKPMGKAGAP